MSELFLGLISGTSMDGVDAAVVAFPERGRRGCGLVATACYAYADDLRAALERAVADPASCHLDTLGRLDVQVGGAFAAAALRLLAGAGLEAADVRAIGSHGQTLRHRPDADTPFTLQIGDPNVIVARTGITTVADFRRRDIALGGEAAPLAPSFHGWLFGDGAPVAVINIGGIANLTRVDGDVRAGFDSGPGNTLMDGWIRRQRDEGWDRDGAWAREGTVSPLLLEACLDDPYFTATPPKSTGREYFNADWLDARLEALPEQPPPVDVQATLCELTAVTVARAVGEHAPGVNRVLVCGGGAHNGFLMERLTELCTPAEVTSTATAGLDPDWVEAAAFAWLARETLAGRPGNRPRVTGAQSAAILGGIYLADGGAAPAG
ncbi:anhydro-N-acetylmuramic acid kinase [Lentisalinibacter sediminis]|uniref:anhydro-N-acetylmuramic acid kinase n=1 Tax=Lentisalinibacter sediminis TaxID=2992237 RepID=UPI003869794B